MNNIRKAWLTCFFTYSVIYFFHLFVITIPWPFTWVMVGILSLMVLLIGYEEHLLDSSKKDQKA